MSIHIRMPDGVKDEWGSKYMKSVYNDRADFGVAISKLNSSIKALERQKSRLAAIPDQVDDLWDDYWHTERLREALEKTVAEYEKTLEALNVATENLKMLVDAAEFYKSKNWGKKSDSERAKDTVTAIFTLGTSGSVDSEKDVHYNC